MGPGRNDFVWVTGTWRVPPPGRFWVNGYWKRDDKGWYRVPGFWSERKTDRLDYRKDGPPQDQPDDEPGDPPNADCFYIPGQYYPDGDGVVWKKGYWTKAQPGWSWVPAQWVRQPDGWVFQEGYWDRTLEDRGILFTPAEVDKTARGADDLTYQPYSKVSPEMYGQLNGAFGRPNSNYDGYPGVYYDDSGPLLRLCVVRLLEWLLRLSRLSVLWRVRLSVLRHAGSKRDGRWYGGYGGYGGGYGGYGGGYGGYGGGLWRLWRVRRLWSLRRPDGRRLRFWARAYGGLGYGGLRLWLRRLRLSAMASGLWRFGYGGFGGFGFGGFGGFGFGFRLPGFRLRFWLSVLRLRVRLGFGWGWGGWGGWGRGLGTWRLGTRRLGNHFAFANRSVSVNRSASITRTTSVTRNGNTVTRSSTISRNASVNRSVSPLAAVRSPASSHAYANPFNRNSSQTANRSGTGRPGQSGVYALVRGNSRQASYNGVVPITPTRTASTSAAGGAGTGQGGQARAEAAISSASLAGQRPCRGEAWGPERAHGTRRDGSRRAPWHAAGWGRGSGFGHGPRRLIDGRRDGWPSGVWWCRAEQWPDIRGYGGGGACHGGRRLAAVCTGGSHDGRLVPACGSGLPAAGWGDRRRRFPRRHGRIRRRRPRWRRWRTSVNAVGPCDHVASVDSGRPRDVPGSVPEMAAAGQDHGHSVLVAGLGRVIVAFGTAGLNDGGHPGGGREVGAVAKREERVGRQHRARGPRACFFDGDPYRIKPAHLACTDTDDLTILCQYDRVGFDRCTHTPCEGEVAQLGLLWATRWVATCPAAGSGSSSSQV